MKKLKRPRLPVIFAYQLSYYNAHHYLLSLQPPTDIRKAKKPQKRDLGPCTPVRNIRTLTMAGHIQQNPWTPTVRIGKIAAETSNPGPAIVQLPTLIGKGERERGRLLFCQFNSTCFCPQAAKCRTPRRRLHPLIHWAKRSRAATRLPDLVLHSITCRVCDPRVKIIHVPQLCRVGPRSWQLLWLLDPVNTMLMRHPRPPWMPRPSIRSARCHLRTSISWYQVSRGGSTAKHRIAILLLVFLVGVVWMVGVGVGLGFEVGVIFNVHIYKWFSRGLHAHH